MYLLRLWWIIPLSGEWNSDHAHGCSWRSTTRNPPRVLLTPLIYASIRAFAMGIVYCLLTYVEVLWLIRMVIGCFAQRDVRYDATRRLHSPITMLEAQQTWSCNMLCYYCSFIFKYSISGIMYAVLVQHTDFSILIAHFCLLLFSFGVRVFVLVFSSTCDFAPRQEFVWKDPFFYATKQRNDSYCWNENTMKRTDRKPIQWIHVSFVKSRSNRWPSNVQLSGLSSVLSFKGTMKPSTGFDY